MQSEPGQQNLLIQPPLGRKRGLRQVSTQNLNHNLFFCIRYIMSRHKIEALCLVATATPAVYTEVAGRVSWTSGSQTLNNPQEHSA